MFAGQEELRKAPRFGRQTSRKTKDTEETIRGSGNILRILIAIKYVLL